MMTLTETATNVVKALSEQLPEAEQPGLRISGAGTETEPGLALAPAASPEPGDQVLDADGAHVFLDSAAASLLDDKVLDAQVGPDGSVQFGVGQQA